MILYGSYTSPYVRHIRVALAQNDLDYEFIETDYRASAGGSPAKRVPFLVDGELKLTDSSSILLHLKQVVGKVGFTDAADFELYTLANTAMDAEINLFLLSRDNLGPENSKYLKRQKARVRSGLEYIDTVIATQKLDVHNPSDGQLRLACFLDWAIFRQRFNLTGLAKLEEFMLAIQSNVHFAASKPPK